MLLKGKIAIVTGGSRGIGLAIVKAYLSEGATVILCGSRKETADAAVNQIIQEIPNAKVEGICPNITDFDDVHRAFKAVAEKYGRIDILVNNAGVSDETAFVDYTAESIGKILNVNVNACIYCAHAVVPYMIEEKNGVIINTSSVVSISGTANGIIYPTSKFALNGFTTSLARELGPSGIRVNAIAPGLIDTDMLRAVSAEYVEALEKSIPLQSLGKAEEVADAFVFLASDKSRYITGTILGVDGMFRS